MAASMMRIIAAAFIICGTFQGELRLCAGTYIRSVKLGIQYHAAQFEAAFVLQCLHMAPDQ